MQRVSLETDNTAGVMPGTNLPASVIYLIAFITGAIVMSFEMLGSRYLNPYFGSGIYTWASLISTVLFENSGSRRTSSSTAHTSCTGRSMATLLVNVAIVPPFPAPAPIMSDGPRVVSCRS